MPKGKVKWFNEVKGWGFIEQEEEGPDVFVHYSSVAGDGYKVLQEGQEVEFEVETTPKGLAAVKVTAI